MYKEHYVEMLKTKIIQVCSYQTYGHAYADHVKEMGIAAEGFYLEKKPNAKFPSKKDIVWGIIYGFAKMVFHFWKFRNVKIYSNGGVFRACCLHASSARF